jgi:putative transposase
MSAQLSPQIVAQAADWFWRFRAGGVSGSECDEFLRWIRQSPQHVGSCICTFCSASSVTSSHYPMEWSLPSSDIAHQISHDASFPKRANIYQCINGKTRAFPFHDGARQAGRRSGTPLASYCQCAAAYADWLLPSRHTIFLVLSHAAGIRYAASLRPQIAFRKKMYSSLEQLQADLDAWISLYNHERTHQGKMCCGRTPMATFEDGKQICREKMMRNLIWQTGPAGNCQIGS